MKHVFFLIGLIAFINPLNAQVFEPSVSASFGFGSLYPNYLSAVDAGTYKKTENKKLLASSAQVGGFLKFKLDKKLAISPGLQIFMIQNRTSWHYEYVSQMSRIGENSAIMYELSMPIPISYTYNNWTFKAGPQIGYVLGLEYKGKEWDENGETIGEGQSSHKPFSFNFGYTLGVEYKVSKRAGIIMNFYQGLRDALIYNSAKNLHVINYPLSLQFGLSYRFIKKRIVHSDTF